MNIAVIGSGHDTFMTLGLVGHTNHQFFCIVDTTYGPREQKTLHLTLERVQVCIDYAISLGAEKIILPPVFELIHKDNPKVIPLYQTYLLQHVFPKSRVGKLGVLGDRKDTSIIQKKIEEIASGYILTDFQSKTKKFQTPFARWCKDVSIWSDFLKRAEPSNWMVRKYIKNDLRYFVDADVDSLLPTSYTHFYRETVLRHHGNFKKMRRQPKSVIQSIASTLLGTGTGFECKIFANDSIEHIYASHTWKGFVQRGEEVQREVIYKDW